MAVDKAYKSAGFVGCDCGDEIAVTVSEGVSGSDVGVMVEVVDGVRVGTGVQVRKMP